MEWLEFLIAAIGMSVLLGICFFSDVELDDQDFQAW